jgi:hypothetical protein
MSDGVFVCLLVVGCVGCWFLSWRQKRSPLGVDDGYGWTETLVTCSLIIIVII